jgi:ferredoxin
MRTIHDFFTDFDLQRIPELMAEPLTLLTLLGERQPPPEQSWERFLERRGALEAQMQLEVCNGCDHCGTRCVAGFGVTHPEWEAVRAFLATQPVHEVERVAAQEKTLPWPGAEELEARVTYCRFRDSESSRCSIYSVRPTICRLLGQTNWLPCPIGAVDAYPEAAADVWNQYRQEKRKTWEEWQDEEEILSSLSNR